MPGVYAPDGEEVDVEKYINEWNSRNPSNGKKDYSDQEIKDLFYYLRGNDKPFIIRDFKDYIEPAEDKKGKNEVGIDMPSYFEKGHSSGYIR